MKNELSPLTNKTSASGNLHMSAQARQNSLALSVKTAISCGASGLFLLALQSAAWAVPSQVSSVNPRQKSVIQAQISPSKGAPQTAFAESKSFSHRVQPGETLNKIATQYRVSAQSLANLNGFSLDTQLLVDENLLVPLSSTEIKSVGMPVVLGSVENQKIVQIEETSFATSPAEQEELNISVQQQRQQLQVELAKLQAKARQEGSELLQGTTDPSTTVSSNEETSQPRNPLSLKNSTLTQPVLLSSKPSDVKEREKKHKASPATSIAAKQFALDVTSLQQSYHQSQTWKRVPGIGERTPSAFGGTYPSPKKDSVPQEVIGLHPSSRQGISAESENSPVEGGNLTTAAAPIQSNKFLPANAGVGEVVEPKLPPLSEREHYLPSGPMAFTGHIWPAKGVLTSGYGWRWGRMHRGIDIASSVGTPILATAPGTITFAGWNSGGFGNLVKIQHPDGSTTLYAHNSRILVRVGQTVKQGQMIAHMGSTGRSTGPHLHFELRPKGSGSVNPIAYLSR